jgi:hypothetical protein
MTTSLHQVQICQQKFVVAPTKGVQFCCFGGPPKLSIFLNFAGTLSLVKPDKVPAEPMKVCKFWKFMRPYGTFLADLPIVTNLLTKKKKVFNSVALDDPRKKLSIFLISWVFRV